jgi:hypothetical protein
MAETPDLDSLSAKWREQANNFDDPRDYPLDDAYRTCADELDAARAAEKAQQAKRPVHPDPDCEFARGVGAYCTCETPEEKAVWIRYREEAQAERDEFEAGRVAARAADPLRREVAEILRLLRHVRVLDCGAHYCRYCPAKSPAWEHTPSCPYVESQQVHTDAMALRDRLSALLSSPPQTEKE